MRGVLVVLGVLIVAVLSANRGVGQEPTEHVGGAQDVTKRSPSMVELLARPVDFEGVLIEVTGFYSPAAALFLSRDLAEIKDFNSAVLVINESNGYIETHCAGHYAIIEGRFDRRIPGSDPEDFVIDDVTKLWIFEGGKWVACWPPLRHESAPSADSSR